MFALFSFFCSENARRAAYCPCIWRSFTNLYLWLLFLQDCCGQRTRPRSALCYYKTFLIIPLHNHELCLILMGAAAEMHCGSNQKLCCKESQRNSAFLLFFFFKKRNCRQHNLFFFFPFFRKNYISFLVLNTCF